MPEKHRIFTTSVARIYPYYVEKAEKKGRTKAEVDAINRADALLFGRVTCEMMEAAFRPPAQRGV